MDLGIAMRPFSSGGTYGRFFEGEASFELSAQFTVFELSDLSSREELRSVVLTAIMFMSQQMMRKVDRSIPKALFLDEAWQMLRGGAMADLRSEEHTSELQSLMRLSYAVFCLKKTNIYET